MCITSLKRWFRRWQYILRTEGLLASIKRGLSFLGWFLFSYQTLYLYKAKLDDDLYKIKLTPKIRNFTLKIISANEQIDQLVAEGFDLDWLLNSGWVFLSMNEALKKGAIAFYLFVERQLVTVSFVAIDGAAVDGSWAGALSDKEAYLGWMGSNLKYRRLSGGFGTYVYLETMKYLRRRGFNACHFTVRKRNTITQNAIAKNAGMKPYGEALYLKVLWWKLWKEKPLPAQLTE